jgi:lysophospholipase L1-like esterase
MIGINDLADKIFTPRQIAYGLKLIIQRIQKFNPQIEIYPQSTLPTTGKYSYLNNLVLEYNRFLKQITSEHRISYIDLHPHFTNEFGELRLEYSRDGLHLTEAGYQAWYSLIMPYFSINILPVNIVPAPFKRYK